MFFGDNLDKCDLKRVKITSSKSLKPVVIVLVLCKRLDLFVKITSINV